MLHVVQKTETYQQLNPKHIRGYTEKKHKSSSPFVWSNWHSICFSGDKSLIKCHPQCPRHGVWSPFGTLHSAPKRRATFLFLSSDQWENKSSSRYCFQNSVRIKNYNRFDVNKVSSALSRSLNTRLRVRAQTPWCFPSLSHYIYIHIYIYGAIQKLTHLLIPL